MTDHTLFFVCLAAATASDVPQNIGLYSMGREERQQLISSDLAEQVRGGEAINPPLPFSLSPSLHKLPSKESVKFTKKWREKQTKYTYKKSHATKLLSDKICLSKMELFVSYRRNCFSDKKPNVCFCLVGKAKD